MSSTQQVSDVLATIPDPELGVSISELGMVRGVEVSDDGHAAITIALTTLGCPLRAEIKREIETRIEEIPDISQVEIKYAEMNSEEKARAMERARKYAREHAPQNEIPLLTRVIAVASGKGGVGKSTVTANLAAAVASQGFTVGVLDADIWGFSIPRMLGVTGRLEARDQKIEPAVLTTPGGGTLKIISMGLLVDEEDTALMWRGLILAKAFEEFLQKVRWGMLDYLFIDMPPGTGDIQMALGRLLPQSAMLIVTTPATVAQKVAARIGDMAQRSHVPVLGVIENMGAFTDTAGKAHEMFGAGGGKQLADELGVPLVASVPLSPEISAGSDSGKPIAWQESSDAKWFTELADRVTSELAPPVAIESCTARIEKIALSEI